MTLLRSFALSVGVVLVSFLLGAVIPIVATVLWPGGEIARTVYGGLHGGEPVLLLLVANVCIYTAAFYVLGLVLRQFRTTISKQ